MKRSWSFGPGDKLGSMPSGQMISGKGSTPPGERLGRGQTVNNLMPMPPDAGPPLPRGWGIKWPWKR